MGALDHLTNLDNLLASAKQEFAHEKEDMIAEYKKEKATIKAQFDKELQALKDQLLAANIQAEVHRSLTADAHSARAAAERVTTQLLTQFASISHTFDEIRTAALAAASATANTVKNLETKTEGAAHDAVEAAKDAIERALGRPANGGITK